MRIGELAARAGVSASAIRFYESSGLLAPVARGANGYRDYSEDTLQRLLMIRSAQRLGFPLEALRGILAHREEIPHAEILQALEGRLAEIDTMRTALLRQRREVVALRRDLEARWASGLCLELPEANAQPSAARRTKRKARAA